MNTIIIYLIIGIIINLIVWFGPQTTKTDITEYDKPTRLWIEENPFLYSSLQLLTFIVMVIVWPCVVYDLIKPLK